MEQNSKLSSIYSLHALLTPLSLNPFTSEEITGCTKEAAKGAKKTTLLFFLFHVLLFQ